MDQIESQEQFEFLDLSDVDDNERTHLATALYSNQSILLSSSNNDIANSSCSSAISLNQDASASSPNSSGNIINASNQNAIDASASRPSSNITVNSYDCENSQDSKQNNRANLNQWQGYSAVDIDYEHIARTDIKKQQTDKNIEYNNTEIRTEVMDQFISPPYNNQIQQHQILNLPIYQIQNQQQPHPFVHSNQSQQPINNIPSQFLYNTQYNGGQLYQIMQNPMGMYYPPAHGQAHNHYLPQMAGGFIPADGNQIPMAMNEHSPVKLTNANMPSNNINRGGRKLHKPMRGGANTQYNRNNNHRGHHQNQQQSQQHNQHQALQQMHIDRQQTQQMVEGAPLNFNPFYQPYHPIYQQGSQTMANHQVILTGPMQMYPYSFPMQMVSVQNMPEFQTMMNNDKPVEEPNNTVAPNQQWANSYVPHLSDEDNNVPAIPQEQSGLVENEVNMGNSNEIPIECQTAQIEIVQECPASPGDHQTVTTKDIDHNMPEIKTESCESLPNSKENSINDSGVCTTYDNAESSSTSGIVSANDIQTQGSDINSTNDDTINDINKLTNNNITFEPSESSEKKLNSDNIDSVPIESQCVNTVQSLNNSLNNLSDNRNVDNQNNANVEQLKDLSLYEHSDDSLAQKQSNYVQDKQNRSRSSSSSNEDKNRMLSNECILSTENVPNTKNMENHVTEKESQSTEKINKAMKTDSTKTSQESISSAESNVSQVVNKPQMSWAQLLRTDTNVNEENNKNSVSNGKVIKPINGVVQTSVSKKIPEKISANHKDTTTVKLIDFCAKYKLDTDEISLRPKGFMNRSNFCYMNATLQALFGCAPLANLLRSLVPYLPALNEELPALNEFVQLANGFTSLPHGSKLQNNRNFKSKKNSMTPDVVCDPAVQPTGVYNLWLATKSHVGRQEDAEEFLGFILNKLDDEMLEILKLGNKTKTEPSPSNGDLNGDCESDGDSWQLIGNKNKGAITRSTEYAPTPISEIFRGETRTRLVKEGDTSSDVIQPFLALQLNIEKASSVKEALEIMTGRDKIEGVTCSKTNQEVAAWQQISLEKLPAVLILHLKCFDYRGSCTKIVKNFDYPIDLKIDAKILSANAKRGNPKQKQYKLFAVEYHDGKEAVKGHYLTDVYHTGYGQWLRYDDSSVKAVNETVVLHPRENKVPYLLYYRRCDTIATPITPNQPSQTVSAPNNPNTNHNSAPTSSKNRRTNGK